MIPVVLTLVTIIIANQKDDNVIISSVITIMLIFGIIYGLIILFRTVSDLPLKRRSNQMQGFTEDLQSTMDMD